MKKNIRSSLLVTSAIIILLMIGIVFSGLSLFNFKAYAAAAESIYNNDINMDEDSFYYNGEKYALSSYSSLIGNTQEIVYDELSNKLVVTGDDAITSLIPKEKFLNIGASLDIGREWGYYINTINDYNDPFGDPSHISLNRRSYVTIFDLSYSFNKNNGEISVGISPLYQYEYVALSPEEEIVVGYQDDGFSESSYTGRIKYELQSLNSPTVISSHTNTRKRYFLKDVSYSMTLYNEQAPNQFNGGYVYNAQQDNGSYFTYMDYEYNGVVRKNKSFPTGSAVALAKSAFSFVTGLVSNVPIVGTAFSMAKTLMSYEKNFMAAANIIDYIDHPITYDEVEKHITSQNFNSNRDEQIRNYGGLLKNMGMIVNTPDDSSIWFGAGNSSKGLFKITDTAINGAPHNYTRLIREIGFKIVDAETENVVEMECALDEYNLYSPVYENINLEGKNNIFLLPKGKNYYEFTPDYSGYYNIDIANSKINSKLSDSLGDIAIENSTAYLEKNKQYKLVLSSGELGCNDAFSVKVASGHLSDELKAKDDLILKIAVNNDDLYTLSTQNENINIKNILIVGKNGLTQYEASQKYVSKPSLTIPLRINEYYIILQNTSTTKAKYSLQVSKCKTGAVGVNNSISFDGQNYAFVKFTDLETGNYTVSLENSDIVQYEVYDSSLNSLTTSLFGNGFCSVNVADSTIYVGAKIENISIDNIVVNKNKNAYQWRIDNNKVSDNTVELERGRDYNIKFYINGKEAGTQFISDNPKSKYSYTLNNGILSIKDYCKADGSYFTLKYSYNNEAAYNAELYIIPKYTQTFKGIHSVVNNDLLAFCWQKSSDLYEIQYRLKRGNEIYQYTISASEQKVGSINSEDIKSKVDKFATKIGYVEICIYQIKIKTSQTIEEHQFNSSSSVDGTYGGGMGTASNPYLISCSRHFENLVYNKDNTVHFRANNYLEISRPIETFYGIFGSNQYPHASVAINYNYHYIGFDSYDEIGMFRYNYGTICNIQVDVNVNVTGGVNSSGAHIASIAAYNYGSLINCRVNNFTVNSRCAAGYVGAIAAENHGLIEDCYSVNHVTTSGKFGGITAENHADGIVRNCGVFGTVDLYIDYVNGKYTTTYFGGVVGINSGTISNCRVGGWDDDSLKLTVHVDYVDNKDLKPYIGTICGYNNGTISACQRIVFILDTGNLHSFRVWFTTYNQKENINNNLG